MKTAIKTNRSAVLAGAAATLAVAAMGFAGAVQARDNVYWSVGVGTPGAVVNVGNLGSVYQPQPVYVQPQPVYIQPQPVYIQPQPVYVQPQPVYYQQQPVYGVPQPVYYGHPGWRGHHGGGYVQAPGPGYYGGRGYAPVYYQRGEREERHHGRHGDRHDD